MKPEFTGAGHPPALVRASARHQPCSVRLRRHAVADSPGLARGDGADVHRGAARRCRARPRPTAARLAFEDIMRLNGKQTIYQMMQLAERIRERGGEPREPLWYKHEYLRRLDLRIEEPGRRAATRGRSRPTTCSSTGLDRLLENLQQRGLPLYLASGTDEVVRQARGRAAGPDAVLRPAHLRRPGRLQDLLQEDGHRADPPRERASAAKQLALLRRRLRRDREHQGGRRPGRRRGQRRGPQRLGSHGRVETRAALGRRRRRRDPRLPRRRSSAGVDPGTMNTTPLDLSRLRVLPPGRARQPDPRRRHPARPRCAAAAAVRNAVLDQIRQCAAQDLEAGAERGRA